MIIHLKVYQNRLFADEISQIEKRGGLYLYRILGIGKDAF